MTIAEEKATAANSYKGLNIFDDVLDCTEIDLEGTNDSDRVSYTDGSMLTLEGGVWIASMWDNSGDDLDSDIYN
jgi:hypothetical protein